MYFQPPATSSDALDSLKGSLKRAIGQRYYSIGVDLLLPAFPFNYRKKILSYVDPAARVVVDLGSGNMRVSDDVIALDAVDYDAVDIVADVQSLPFRDVAVDCFASRSVLEHVPDVPRVVAEIRRCTRPGGLTLHHTPFLFPFHASPHDYLRFTHTGVLNLFPRWSLLEQSNTRGPVSLLLVLIADLIATVLSGGSHRIRPYAYLAACVVLFPFKIFDWPFIGRSSMLAIAPTIVTVMRKP